MYPLYKSMDSYPHQRNQMPPTHPYFPSFDPARSYVPHESSPYGCNYGYPMPIGFHGCCNHSYFPGYYSYRPPHSHFQPPSPYPVFPETYPFYYASPPHYPMEQPRYEYDKNGPRDHCCGYPHHLCKSKEDSNGKIDEHEPDVEKRSGNSLVPMEFRDNPYPVVWIPSGYMKTKENEKPIESELKAREENGNLRSSGEEPRVWNGLFPFDMNSHGPTKCGGDGKIIENRANEEKNQFPFPIFWMPYKHDEIESKGHKEANTGQKSIEKLPSNSDTMIQPRETKEKPGSEVDSKKMEKNANQKTIPVKQLEQHEEKRTSESVDEKAGGITVKQIEGNGEKRLSENGVKRQPSSPKNTSKLPPVCLRVDPLPKRSRSSRSPSPPGLKRLSEMDSESSKNTQQEIQCMNSPLNETKQAEPSEKDKKIIEAAEGMTLQDKVENCSISTQEEVSKSQITCEKGEKDMEKRKPGEEIKSGDGESEIKEEEGTGKAKEEKSGEWVKAKSKNFSEAEAAVIIQSIYRGFEVRKWESLKKLKRIAQVREEMVWIRHRIQALQSSGIGSDERERLVIGETIMNLLLKLDTIQDLLPSIRDVRKSAAKELVNMQETLDSLTITKSDVSAAKTVEDLSKITGDDLDIQEQQKEAKEVGLEDNFTHEDTSQLMVVEKEESEGLKEENLEMSQSIESQNGVLDDEVGEGVDVVSQVESNASKEKPAGLEDENLLEDGKLEIEALGKELGHIDELVKVSESEGDKVGSKAGIEEITVQQEIELGKMGDLVEASKLEEILHNRERDDEGDDKVGSQEKVEEITVQEEIGIIGDLVETSKPEEIPYDEEHEENQVDKVGSDEEIKKITVQQEMGNMGDLVEDSKPEEILHRSKEEIEEIIVQQEIDMGNMGSMGNLVEARIDNCESFGNSSGSEASELKKPLSELSTTDKEINEREVQEDDAITDANDNSPMAKGTMVVSQEKEVPTEERKENCAKEAIGEEHQGCGLGSELGEESDRKLIDENERLRKMMEKLIETGQEQLTAIANLNGRVKDLEKKLAKKKSKTRRFRAARNGS